MRLEFTPDTVRAYTGSVEFYVSKIAEGGAQYALLCRPDGGVLDDLFTYWLEDERFLSVVNAANSWRPSSNAIGVYVAGGVPRG